MKNTYELPKYVPLLLLAGALLILYHRLLLGEVFVWGLPTLQFYPWRLLAVDLLGSGQLPLWNPYNGAGAPLFANYQSMLLYPLSWPSLILPTASMLSLMAVVHLAIGGWGMWRFSQRLGYSALGSGLSTLAFGLTSYLVGRLGTFPMVAAGVWLPWLCWAVHGIVLQRRRIDTAWLALFTALLLLAGHAQTAWYSLLLTGVYALWLAARQRQLRLPILVGPAAGFLIGAMVAGVQLAATAELLLVSQRSGGVEREFALNFSYAPVRAVNLIAPDFFGNPGDGSFITKGAFFEDAVYIGLIPLVSALAAVIAWLRRRRDLDRPAYFVSIPFWVVIVVVGFIFALGSFAPIFPFLYDNVPTFDLFQAPVRWHLWTVFGLSALAGAGVSAWRRTRPAKRWAGRLVAVCAAAVLVGGLGPLYLEGMDQEVIATMLRGLFVPGLIGVSAGILTLVQPDPAHARHLRWSWAVLIVVTLDLIWASWRLNPAHPASFAISDATNDTSTRAYWPPEIEDEVKFGTYFLFDDYRAAVELWPQVRSSQLPNLNILDRLPLLNNFDPLRPDGYETYMNLIAEHPASTGTLLQAAGVDRVLTSAGTTRPLEPSGRRAWLVGAACWHSDAGALTAALIDGAWQPERQVHLLGDGDCPALTDESEVGRVLTLEDSGATLSIGLRVERAGWLVLADTFYPGWMVEINGRSAVVEQANLMMRAVAVTPDTRSVRFVYQPSWLLPGALISGLGLLILLVWFRTGMAANQR